MICFRRRQLDGVKVSVRLLNVNQNKLIKKWKSFMMLQLRKPLLITNDHAKMRWRVLRALVKSLRSNRTLDPILAQNVNWWRQHRPTCPSTCPCTALIRSTPVHFVITHPRERVMSIITSESFTPELRYMLIC